MAACWVSVPTSHHQIAIKCMATYYRMCQN